MSREMIYEIYSRTLLKNIQGRNRIDDEGIAGRRIFTSYFLYGSVAAALVEFLLGTSDEAIQVALGDCGGGDQVLDDRADYAPASGGDYAGGRVEEHFPDYALKPIQYRCE